MTLLSCPLGVGASRRGNVRGSGPVLPVLDLMELPSGQGGKEPMRLAHEDVVVPEEPVFMSGSAPSAIGVEVQDPERPLRGLTATQPGGRGPEGQNLPRFRPPVPFFRG